MTPQALVRREHRWVTVAEGYHDYWESLALDRYDTPEEQLAAAILIDAFNTAHGKFSSFSGYANGYARTRLIRQARWWFRNDGLWMFSLRLVCQILDLDIDAVRRAALAPARLH